MPTSTFLSSVSAWCSAENGELPSGLAIQELDVDTAYSELQVLDRQHA